MNDNAIFPLYVVCSKKPFAHHIPSILWFTDVEDDFDWGAYLLEGIERYIPSDEDSSVSLIDPQSFLINPL